MKTRMIKLLLAMACLFSSISVSAYDFKVDGIYYNVVSISNLTCAFNGTETKCSGSFVIPDQVTFNNRTFTVTEIGYGAFIGCSGLTSVTIPNSVTEISNSAFFGCSGLTSVTIPNSVTKIGGYAFRDCSGLTSVTIPNSVTKIGRSAFEGCSSLTSITIPNSVTEIGIKALYCKNLQEVELGGGLLELPSSRTTTQSNSNYYYSYYSLFEYFEYSTSSLSTLPSLTKLRIADSENTLSMTTFVNEKERNTGYFSNLPIKELYIGRDLKCGMDPFNGTAIEKLEFGGKKIYYIGPLPSLRTLVLGENIESISYYLSCPFTNIYKDKCSSNSIWFLCE